MFFGRHFASSFKTCKKIIEICFYSAVFIDFSVGVLWTYNPLTSPAMGIIFCIYFIVFEILYFSLAFKKINNISIESFVFFAWLIMFFFPVFGRSQWTKIFIFQML